MSERPIEEVIGWSYNGCDMSRFDGWWWNGSRYVEGATVDDLAAWLASRGYAHTMAAALIEGAQAYVRADLDFPADAPILSALTAAVRKLAPQ